MVSLVILGPLLLLQAVVIVSMITGDLAGDMPVEVTEPFFSIFVEMIVIYVWYKLLPVWWKEMKALKPVK